MKNKLGSLIANVIKKVMEKPYLIYVLILCFFVISCNISPDENDNGNGVKPPTPVYPDIDQYPAWSPDGNVIVYYHTGVTSVEASGLSHVNRDSVGLGFISPTGDNKRQFLKGNNRTPAWSPDGNWIAFVNGAQIYKIKTNGDSLTQLTFEGHNFYPTWSPDGQWVACARSVCEGDRTCGIWIINSNGEQNRFIAEYGMYPTWNPFKNEILYIRRVVTEKGEVLGDSLWVFDVERNENMPLIFLTGVNDDNRYPKYSSDGLSIVFASNAQIWVMDSDGTNLLQLTQKGGNYPAWSPDGNYIVYTYNNYTELDDENGRLWIMDSDGDNKRQLTFMNK